MSSTAKEWYFWLELFAPIKNLAALFFDDDSNWDCNNQFEQCFDLQVGLETAGPTDFSSIFIG